MHPNPINLDAGERADEYTLENYKYLIFGPEGASDAFNKVDLMMFVLTVIAAIAVTIMNLILCYPLAYFLAYILFMLFPMYNVIESLDRNQTEAVRDMGASWPRIHRRVVIHMPSPALLRV